MRSSSILYLGGDSGTSRHRALALRRLGHEVLIVEPERFLPDGRFSRIWSWQTGGLFFENRVRRKLLAGLPKTHFDLVFVDSGDLLGPSVVRELNERYGTIVNYNIDDPYGERDGQHWRLYRAAVPFYHLIVVVRDCNVDEAFAAGARDVLRVHRSADEIAHAPRSMRTEDFHKWGSEVSFIGTWMPERGPFMTRLLALGVPLSIYGDRWQKAPEWPALRAAWRGGSVYEEDYARAIQCAKVNLGLLSKENRDTVTTRSFEIPHLGGVFCAQRTDEHTELYKEGEEAVFWSSPEECAAKCMELLGDETRRMRLAMNGRNRCLKNNTTNEAVLLQILCGVLNPERAQVNSLAEPKRGNSLFTAAAAIEGQGI